MARAAEAVTACTQAARLASLADNESVWAEDAVATVRRQRDDAVAELEAARRRLDRAAASVRDTEQEVLSVQNTTAQMAQQARDATAAQAAAEEARTQAIEAAGVAITEQLRTQLTLCGKGDLVAQLGGPPVNCSVCDDLALPFQARDCRRCRTVVCWGCLSGLSRHRRRPRRCAGRRRCGREGGGAAAAAGRRRQRRLQAHGVRPHRDRGR